MTTKRSEGDRRPLAVVLRADRWDGLTEAEVNAMIASGAFKLAGFRALDRLLAVLEDRGLRVDEVEISSLREILMEIRVGSYTSLLLVRRAVAHLFETSPLTWGLEQVSSEYVARGSSPKRGPDLRKQRPRHFSLAVAALPEDWQASLADMRIGIAGEDAAAPTPSIAETLARKVGELAKVAQDAGLPMEVTKETAVAYERSLLERERPLAAATIHSSMVHIHHFARYLGLDQETVEHLASRVRAHERRLTEMTPLKQARAALLPGYAEILGLALAMLAEADLQANPRVAQKLRNHAAAIALFCPFPLRVADSRLRFGETVFWTGEAWRIDIPETSKTGEPFEATLRPFFSRFVDALILRGASAEYLDRLRGECLDERRLLFVNANGREPHDNYVSYAWKHVFGTGSHISRTKIHDELSRLGPRGVELALKACTQTSPETAEHYRTLMFGILAGDQIHGALEEDLTEEEWQTHFGDPAPEE